MESTEIYKTARSENSDQVTNDLFVIKVFDRLVVINHAIGMSDNFAWVFG